MHSDNPNVARRRTATLGARALLVAGFAAALAGCNTTTTADTTGGIPLAYSERHPITVKEGQKSLVLFVGAGRGGLSPSQRAEVLAFAQNWKRDATGGVSVESGAGGSAGDADGMFIEVSSIGLRVARRAVGGTLHGRALPYGARHFVVLVNEPGGPGDPVLGRRLAHSFVGAGVRAEPGREFIHGGCVERRVGPVVMWQVSEQPAPGVGSQHAGRKGHVAGGALLLVLGEQGRDRPALIVIGARRMACREQDDGHDPTSMERAAAIHLSVLSQAITSAFSAALHSRPMTSLQLRRNHFSVFAASVNRSGLNAGARAAIGLPVEACWPAWVGWAPWHDAQLHSRP